LRGLVCRALLCPFHCLILAHEQFFHDENRQHLKLLDQAARQSGLSRGEVFSDFLLMSVASLSGGQMEDQYMDVVKRHSAGERGKRSCDTIAQLYGSVISAMETDCREGMKDVLGDLFEGAVSYGENGLFLTPPPICRVMAKLTVGDVGESRERKTVCDPAVGTGRMLMAVAEEHPHWEFVGTDTDIRCVRISVLNMALRNIYSYIIHGNSLTLQTHRVYRTGFNGRGVVKEIPPDACPYPISSHASQPVADDPAADATPVTVIDHREADDDDRPQRQGTLF